MMIDCINHHTYNPLISPSTPLFHITYILHPKSVISYHPYLFLSKILGQTTDPQQTNQYQQHVFFSTSQVPLPFN